MNNLEKIVKGFSFGYSATLSHEGEYLGQVIDVSDHGVLAIIEQFKSQFISDSWINMNCKIIGWKYAGELAGNEPIPYEQKFRFKESGRVFVYGEWMESKSELSKFDKSEIEPIFPK